MIKRSLRIFMSAVLGLIALCVIAAGSAAWRLSRGPVELDFLTPYLASTLTPGMPGKASLEIGETVLIWADWSRAADIRLRNVRLISEAGVSLVDLPELSINLSVTGLLFGLIVPSKVEAFGASIILVRQEDGGFDFEPYGFEESDVASAAPPDADLSLILPELIKELITEPRRDDPLSFLQAVRVVDGSVFVIDRSMDSIWHAPSATVSVQRLSDGLAARAWLSFDDRPDSGDLELSLSYQASSQTIDMDARFDSLYPPSLGVFGAALAPLSGVNFPLSGAIDASLDARGRLRSLRYEMAALPGSLSLPEYLPQSLAVHGLSVRGEWDREAGTLRIDEAQASVSPGGGHGDPGVAPEVSFTGVAKVADGGLRLDFEGQARRVPAEDLTVLWPTEVAEGARDWVTENIRKGRADEAKVSARLWFPAGDPGAVAIEELSGGYRYSDLEVHYRKPLPPATGVSGVATFDRAGMDFEPRSGRVGNLSIESSKIAIRGLDKKDQDINIDLRVRGPLRDALTLLNHESLGLISELGVDPARTAGDAVTDVTFAFPLIKDLSFDSVRVAARGEIENLRLERAALDRDVSDGSVRLEVDNDGMTVDGPVVFAQVPIDLSWEESFRKDAAVQSAFHIAFERLSRDQLESLGLGVEDFLDGDLGGTLDLRLDSQRNGTMAVSADLAGTRLTLSHLNWVKPLNVPGRLDATLRLQGERFVDFEITRLAAGSLAARGRGRFDETGDSLSRLELEDVSLERNRLDSVALEWEEGGTRIVLGEGELDAEPFLSDGAKESAGGTGDRGLAAPNLLISAPHLNAVRFGNGRKVNNVGFLMERRDGSWRRLSLKGSVPEALWTDTAQPRASGRNGVGTTVGNNKFDEGAIAPQETAEPAEDEEEDMGPNREQRSFSLDYAPGQGGRYGLTIKADDVGGLLRAFNLNDTVKGGRLSIEGGSTGPIPMKPLEGKIRVKDFVLVDTPVLARLLSVASLTGLLDTLSGSGIRFDRLKGDFVLTDGVAHTELLRAYGPGLGITAHGQIDFDRAAIDLEGTLVPAYSINQLLGKIPLVGTLLTGGEGEGLFAVLYRASGPLAEPEVSVNPLSLLTPGFLRSLFGRPGGDAPSVFPSGPGK